MELQAKASTARPGKAESIIFIFLEGGPSHIDMWDLKPDAPAEIRGPYRQIPTNVRESGSASTYRVAQRSSTS